MTKTNKHNSYKITITSLLLILLFVSCNVSAEQKSFLWKVKSKTATVYLLGSIHFAKPEIYPLNKNIELAFENSNTLVLEIDQNKIDQNEMRRLIVKRGIYPETESIKQDLDEQTHTLLIDYLNKYNMPIEAYSTMRPGFLAMSLTVAHVVRLGYLPQYGIDQYFLDNANKKKVLQLETVEEQLELFFNVPKEELFLKHTLMQLESMETQIADIITAWQNGDTKKLTQFLLVEPLIEYPQMTEIFEKMYTQRNIKMAKKIEAYLRQTNRYFVVVGAGHLIGDQGILSLLSAKGFKIEQL